MDRFNQICKQIKELKIQGAEAVAKAAVQALNYKNDKKSVQKLISLRPTEPCMRNAIKFALKFGTKAALKHFEESRQKIVEYGSKKIKKDMLIYTHCHSSTVIAVLKKAKEQGTKFSVHNTETRPLFQGRITAKELAKLKIPVTLFVDSAMRLATKKADLMLLGCDAITSEGKIINKIGSELAAETSQKYGTPLYICTDSWKFDPKTIFGYIEKIEERAFREIWPKPPKGVKISNLSFERINPDLVTAIVSELGVLTPENFITEIRRAYPWMLK